MTSRVIQAERQMNKSTEFDPSKKFSPKHAALHLTKVDKEGREMDIAQATQAVHVLMRYLACHSPDVVADYLCATRLMCTRHAAELD